MDRYILSQIGSHLPCTNLADNRRYPPWNPTTILVRDCLCLEQETANLAFTILAEQPDQDATTLSSPSSAGSLLLQPPLTPGQKADSQSYLDEDGVVESMNAIMNPVLPDRPVHEALMREAIAMVR